MKNKLNCLIIFIVIAFSLLGCDISATRPLTANVTVMLQDIPSETAKGNPIGAVALYCNLNEWKASQVNGSPVFITTVQDGKAKFVLEGYTLSETLKFQFTPLPSVSTTMGDDWWSYALSGSSQYANDENNMVCNFLDRKINADCTVVVSKDTFTSAGGSWSPFPCYNGADSSRQFNEGYTSCFKIE